MSDPVYLAKLAKLANADIDLANARAELDALRADSANVRRQLDNCRRAATDYRLALFVARRALFTIWANVEPFANRDEPFVIRPFYFQNQQAICLDGLGPEGRRNFNIPEDPTVHQSDPVDATTRKIGDLRTKLNRLRGDLKDVRELCAIAVDSDRDQIPTAYLRSILEVADSALLEVPPAE